MQHIINKGKNITRSQDSVLWYKVLKKADREKII